MRPPQVHQGQTGCYPESFPPRLVEPAGVAAAESAPTNSPQLRWQPQAFVEGDGSWRAAGDASRDRKTSDRAVDGVARGSRHCEHENAVCRIRIFHVSQSLLLIVRHPGVPIVGRFPVKKPAFGRNRAIGKALPAMKTGSASARSCLQMRVAARFRFEPATRRYSSSVQSALAAPTTWETASAAADHARPESFGDDYGRDL